MMTISLFISYSHKDEQFKEELIEHLSSFRQSGLIRDWHDRKILPGQDFNHEIHEHLESSELIIFLISSAFLTSNYCMGVEARKALEMNKAGNAKLVPVVVRSVEWSQSELSNLLALPKDAKPIDTWSNRDEAWLSVTNGLKKILEHTASNNFVPRNPGVLSLTNSFLDWLEDTEISLSHRKVGVVRLQDIYTLQDVEIHTPDDQKDNQKTIECSETLLDRFDRLVILGDEQQGKTSLLKFYFRRLHRDSFVPLYIDGAISASANLVEILTGALREQYAELTYEEFMQTDKKVLLIDNIDKSKLNRKYRNRLIEEVCEAFDRCIFALAPYALWIDEVRGLHSFQRAKLLDMGHKRREEIIQKWVSLGVEQTISDDDLYVQCDEIKDSIDAVIRRNLVPPKPVFILILLQLLEATTKLNLDLSSHGYCYQQLIFQSFTKAGVKASDIDSYLNVLTELSWWIFKNEQDPTPSQLDKFFGDYCKEFLEVDKMRIIGTLKDALIIKESSDSRIGFKYSYIYYFFVGKKISESYIEDESVQCMFSMMTENAHREDFANILIFITHHTKSSWVIEGISNALRSLFSEYEAATLSSDQLVFMDDFIKSIPALVVDQRDIQVERNKRHETLDILEMDEVESDTDESVGLLSNINKTFKGIEIAGQIIRNRHASLKECLNKLPCSCQNGATA